MQPGEVVVARLSKGPTIVRYVEEAASRVTVALGRNRQARIPLDRIVLGTGLTFSAEEELEQFRRDCREMASEIDLSEVWEVVTEDAVPLGLESLADLYWGSTPDAAHRVALTLYLEESNDYFERGDKGYGPRSREAVAETQARRRREAEKAEAAASLMRNLSQGQLPQPMGRDAAALLEDLRGYAVQGDDYARGNVARRLLDTEGRATRDLQRRSFELLVAAGVFSPDEPLELHRAGIGTGPMPEDAVSEAGAIGTPDPLSDASRRDLTGIPAITIDDADTEDRDDALSLETLGAGEPLSGFRIGIHIADAGAQIPHGGAIDREADRRMATMYLPEGTIGMLPPGFSRRVGSLDPGESRLAVSLLVDVDPSAELLGWEVTPSAVRARASLTYEEADDALDDETSPWRPMMTRLAQVAQALRRRREEAGAINIDRAEMSVKVRSPARVEVKVLKRSTPSRVLVSELMILCNSLLAEFCRREGLPAVYRSQAAPDLSDVPAASQAAEPLRQHLIMRRLSPAELDTIPAPHAGLGAQAYIQATSPLRRYPDLVMQRQISHFLSSGEPFYSEEEVASVVQRAEVQLRELARLEEQRKRYWFLKYLKQSRLEADEQAERSALFAATVLENEPRRAALVELAEFPFRARAELPGARMPGDRVTLRLQGVDLWRRAAYFIEAAEGR